jgi:putative chitinase
MITWKKGQYKKLSKYFSSKEFENTTDKEFYIDIVLLEKLDLVRGEFGEALVVTSGYRSPLHNAKVGGASSSQHCLGRAADIRPSVSSKQKLDKLYLICEKYFEAVGDGRKKGFIHVDTRVGKLRRWDY